MNSELVKFARVVLPRQPGALSKAWASLIEIGWRSPVVLSAVLG